MITSAINKDPTTKQQQQQKYSGSSSSNATMDVTEGANMNTASNKQNTNNKVANKAARNQSIEPSLTCELTAQLEYYFSYHNLIKDDFLRSKMAQHDGYVPVELLAGFNHVIKIFLRSTGGRHMLDLSKEKALQLRCSLLLEAAASSSKLEVAPLVTNPDGNVVVWGIRPRADAATTKEALPQEVVPVDSFLKTPDDAVSTKHRQKVIFRCVPTGVTQEDIFSIIQRASEGLEVQIDAIQQDVGDCWFVNFKQDLDNKDIIADCIMRMRDMDLMGQTIKARLKTEAIRDPTSTTTAIITTPVGREMFVAAITDPTLPSNHERRRMPKKGRKLDKGNGHSSQNGGVYGPRKPHNKRTGNGNGNSNSNGTSSAAGATRHNCRSPPGVHDSNHFPVLGNRNATHSPLTPPQPRDGAAASNDVTPQVTASSAVIQTHVITENTDTVQAATAPPPSMPVRSETKEIQGAYAAALLRCNKTTNATTGDTTRSATSVTNTSTITTTAIATKQESTPKKSTTGCWVRGYPIIANDNTNKSPQKDTEHKTKANNSCDKVDCNFTSSCSIDNEAETEKTASTTLSISSASSGTSTPVQPVSSSWGGLKKSFADVVKAQQVCIS